MNAEQLIEINPMEVKFLIHRERDPEGFARLKEAIRAIGVRQPLHVRDISGWAAKDRRRPDGGLYRWEAHFGEGRTTACLELYRETKEKRWLRLPAIVKDIPEGEIVGRFLSENLLRRDHSWLEQARLIKGDVDAEIAAHGKADVAAIAGRYFISEAHAAKLMRVLQTLSPRVTGKLKGLSLEQASSLITLPAAGQEIVMETLTEGRHELAQLPAIIAKARKLEESGELSKSALKASLKRVDEDLERIRPKLKLARLHHALGPENLEILLSDKKFRVELDRHGINYKRFSEEIK